MKTNERGDPYTTGPVEDPQARAEALPAQDSSRCMLSDMLIREEAERVANLALRGRLVLIESPYKAETPELRERNRLYLILAMRDSLARGEYPFASVLLYATSGVLDDDQPDQRALGIEAGLAWGAHAVETVVYADLGISPGMQQGIDRALAEGRVVSRRLIGTGSMSELDLLRGGRGWEDRPTEDDAAIEKAGPWHTGEHARYGRALALVEARHSKYALVDLVNWLLARAEKETP